MALQLLTYRQMH